MQSYLTCVPHTKYCHTNELGMLPIGNIPNFCNPLGVRTRDPFIKSEVLYLLS